MLACFRAAEQQAPGGNRGTFWCNSMRTKPKQISGPVGAARMVEEVVGCKWSLGVLHLVRTGVRRPGAMEHALPGLSKKVLNERLRKFVRFGILERQAYAEIPPRVEYRLTALGERFARLMDGVEALQKEIDADAQSGTSRGLRGAREASRS
jgi:DNA-binding HxlR family transcriptional regulator